MNVLQIFLIIQCINEKNQRINFNRYSKLKKLKVLYIWNETLIFSIVCCKCGSNNDLIF